MLSNIIWNWSKCSFRKCMVALLPLCVPKCYLGVLAHGLYSRLYSWCWLINFRLEASRTIFFFMEFLSLIPQRRALVSRRHCLCQPLLTRHDIRQVTWLLRISCAQRKYQSQQNWHRFLVPPSRETAAISSAKCGASYKYWNNPSHDSI